MSLSETETTLKTVIMEKTYNAQQAIIAQKEYLKELAKNNQADWMADNFSKGIGLPRLMVYATVAKSKFIPKVEYQLRERVQNLLPVVHFATLSYVD